VAAKEALINAELPPTRFKIGTRVEARIGPDSWAQGVVVDIHYREPTWPMSESAPYQIKVDNTGELMYAPADIDEVVRAI
jgi:hypothetical protein